MLCYTIDTWHTALKINDMFTSHSTMSKEVTAENRHVDMVGFHVYTKLLYLVDDARSTKSTFISKDSDGLARRSWRSDGPALDKWARLFNNFSIFLTMEPDLSRDDTTVQS